MCTLQTKGENPRYEPRMMMTRSIPWVNAIQAGSVKFERLKEYLQSNIQILQEQIEWNDRMKQVEMQLREQGTTMTPIMKVNRGTSMNETTVAKSLPEALYCLHCTEWGHDIYQCQVPGKRKKDILVKTTRGLCWKAIKPRNYRKIKLRVKSVTLRHKDKTQ